MPTTQRLFSYGTLQNVAVQLETFGRILQGSADILLDYRLQQVKIDDKKVVALSGQTHHPMAISSAGHEVHGVIFDVTPAELMQSDAYEVGSYQRVLGDFKSGRQAWAYVQADGCLVLP